MNTKIKENYVTPESLSVVLASESIICTGSEITGMDAERIDYGGPEYLNW